MIENSLAGQGHPEPEAVLLACRDKRFEQPVANLFVAGRVESMIRTAEKAVRRQTFVFA